MLYRGGFGLEKNLIISILLDYYGALLSDTQFNCTDLYYNEDYSLSEISEHEGITRQGVRDSIKHAEELLIKYEDKLKLYEKQKQVNALLDEMKEIAGEDERVLSLINRLSEI